MYRSSQWIRECLVKAQSNSARVVSICSPIYVRSTDTLVFPLAFAYQPSIRGFSASSSALSSPSAKFCSIVDRAKELAGAAVEHHINHAALAHTNGSSSNPHLKHLLPHQAHHLTSSGHGHSSSHNNSMINGNSSKPHSAYQKSSRPQGSPLAGRAHVPADQV